MGITYKVLGQSKPSANTLTTLYSVPASNSAIVSSINVCNNLASNTYFSVAVRPANAIISDEHFIANDSALPASDSIAITLSMTLGATDVVSVRSYSGNVSFNAFGTEIN